MWCLLRWLCPWHNTETSNHIKNIIPISLYATSITLSLATHHHLHFCITLAYPMVGGRQDSSHHATQKPGVISASEHFFLLLVTTNTHTHTQTILACGFCPSSRSNFTSTGGTIPFPSFLCLVNGLMARPIFLLEWCLKGEWNYL
jgi:hypothetical protein